MFSFSQKINNIDHQYEIPASEFISNHLKIIDKVEKQHVEYVITKYGRPVAKLIPVEEVTPEVFGSVKGTVTVVGDIVSSMHEVWDDRLLQ